MGEHPTGGKLVRDRIPDIIRAAGQEPTIRRLSIHEYEAALRAKLVEEAEEAQQAVGRDHVLDELADVLEVLMALAAASDANLEEVHERARAKAASRGAFRDRVWLQG